MTICDCDIGLQSDALRDYAPFFFSFLSFFFCLTCFRVLLYCACQINAPLVNTHNETSSIIET